MSGADRRQAPGTLARVGPLLAAAAVAGFALGGCGGGGGGALSTLTDLTVTRTRTTATETTTTEVTTTAPGPTTTAPAPPPPPPPASTEAGSSSSTPWGWIILGVALFAALVIGLVVWRRHRAGAASWSAQTADLSRRCLRAMDDVLAKGSVVTGEIQALTSEAQSLEARAPDDSSRAAAARLRGGLDELARTLEADRTLRLGSPPPSGEQLSYSTALIRQQVEQLQGVLRTPSTGQGPT